MATTNPIKHAAKDTGGFPVWRDTIRLGGNKKFVELAQSYDVKFYPFIEPGVDAVFAYISNRSVIVARPVKNEKTYAIEELRRFEDQDDENRLNSLAWSKDPVTGDPLVCATGQTATIKIYNVISGKHERTLVGHGQLISDLVVSPLNPYILYSAAEDHEIRAWNLLPEYAKSPCAAVFVGEGNTSHVQSIDVHQSCRYILASGPDQSVNLWVAPKNIEKLPVLPAVPGEREHIVRVHYPHFKSQEVHGDNIDCIKFYGDFILSRAVREGKIILWKIDNFSSETEPPEEPPANTSIKDLTRSAWGGSFQILLEFKIDPVDPVHWVKFSLFYEPGFSPILSWGASSGTIYFWNLDFLGVGDGKLPKKSKKKQEPREASTTSFSNSDLVHGMGKIKVPAMYKLDDPFAPLRHHHQAVPAGVPHREIGVMPPQVRSIAWSNCGKWCVAGMDLGYVCLYST